MSRLQEYLEAKNADSLQLAILRGDVSRLHDIINMSARDFGRYYADSKSRMEAFEAVLKQLNDNFKKIKS